MTCLQSVIFIVFYIKTKKLNIDGKISLLFPIIFCSSPVFFHWKLLDNIDSTKLKIDKNNLKFPIILKAVISCVLYIFH